MTVYDPTNAAHHGERPRTCFLDGCAEPAPFDSLFCRREHALAWIEANPDRASRADLTTLVGGPAYPTYDDWPGPVKAAAEATKAGKRKRRVARGEERGG